MAIKPISMMSVNANGNLSFCATNKKKDAERPSERHVSSPLKVVPLATLIAMSPMTTSVQEAFATEPQKPNVVLVEDEPVSEPVKLPENCKILKNVRIDYPKSGYLAFNLIDTDGDDSDFELMEVLESATGNALTTRGILKGIQVNRSGERKSVRLLGIELDRKNTEDYRPKGIMSESYQCSDEMCDMYESILGLENNNVAVTRVTPQINYNAEYYDYDLANYKKLLNIK